MYSDCKHLNIGKCTDTTVKTNDLGELDERDFSKSMAWGRGNVVWCMAK